MLHQTSMELFQSQRIFSCFSIWFLFHFSSLFFHSASYTLPYQYFINCGSASTVLVYKQRNFTGDGNSGNSVYISGDSKTAEDPNSSADELYQTARIFRKPSSYELDLDQNGTYVVRLHFFPFASLGNLSDARFRVFAAGFSLLSNFTVQNNSGHNFPLIEEFLLKVTQRKFRIYFEPDKGQYFAFVNAIEVILAPPDFIPGSAPHVTREGPDEDYNDVLKRPLRIIHRINVGGETVARETDTMLRYWIPDDDYLLLKNTARNSTVYTGKIEYQIGVAQDFDAPDSVYNTAKEMNIGNDSNGLSNFNISWRFGVRKGAEHLVRLHFCDIVSRTTNEFFRFNLYIYSNYWQEMYPYGVISQLAAPFYYDFVVFSDDSGFMNISVGPNRKSQLREAFLNGVEIMELIRDRGPAAGRSDSKRNHLLIIIGSGVGCVIVVLIIMIMFVFGIRKRKWKSVEAFDWPLIPFHGGSSYSSRTTVRTVTASPLADLNLGLRVPLSEILFATKYFATKLLIGEGGFGKVYKGKLRNGKIVAVKRSDPGHGQGLPEFHTEIMVLSKIRHHHLVSLIGYCDERNEMILVYEFMENGTLRDHLYDLPGETEKSSLRIQFSWEQRLQICIGAAKGLHYLHTGSSGTIIHRDIKSTNILLDDNYVAKVADFGLSRSGPLDQSHVSTEVKGSFGYLDPEYFKCLQLTQKSDVYSFGVVLLEVLCARPAIVPTLPREQVGLADWGMSCQRKGQLEKIVDPFLVGKINPNSLRKFSETVEKCLQESGADRPYMVDVLWDLEYCLQLQHSAIPRQPYEDSTTDASLSLPMPVVQRLPSNSIVFHEDEVALTSYSFSDASQLDASAVFSQLKMDEAR